MPRLLPHARVREFSKVVLVKVLVRKEGEGRA